MFVGQPLATQGQGVSRPFILGLVLLLLFLSMQTDWTPGTRKTRLDLTQTTASSSNKTKEDIKQATRDKLIYELSVSNDNLERENRHLRQHILDIRRAARGCLQNKTALFEPDAAESAGMNLTHADPLEQLLGELTPAHHSLQPQQPERQEQQQEQLQHRHLPQLRGAMRQP